MPVVARLFRLHLKIYTKQILSFMLFYYILFFFLGVFFFFYCISLIYVLFVSIYLTVVCCLCVFFSFVFDSLYIFICRRLIILCMFSFIRCTQIHKYTNTLINFHLKYYEFTMSLCRESLFYPCVLLLLLLLQFIV